MRYIHKKQSGGSGQFADVQIRFEPGEPGSGFEFVSEIKGGAVPKEFIPGVVKVGVHGHAARHRQSHGSYYVTWNSQVLWGVSITACD